MEMKTMNKVTRAFSLDELVTKDESYTIEGYAAVFNQRTNIGDYFYEEIDPKAFDNTIFDDCCFLLNHDMSRITLARARRNNSNSTMQIGPDNKGLHVKATLDVEGNPDAKAIYSATKRGDITGMSFLFVINKQEWSDLDKEMPIRRILGISRVYEVSAVNFPAYEGTEIYARSTDTLENEKKALENARAVALVNDKSLELERQKVLFKIKNSIGGNLWI